MRPTQAVFQQALCGQEIPCFSCEGGLDEHPNVDYGNLLLLNRGIIPSLQ